MLKGGAGEGQVGGSKSNFRYKGGSLNGEVEVVLVVVKVDTECVCPLSFERGGSVFAEDVIAKELLVGFLELCHNSGSDLG